MKKAKLVMAIVTVFVLAAELCFGVFASNSASYNITGTITYTVENNITANTSVTSLSASRTCSHQDATGNVSASTGVNISDYFTVVLNGSTLTNDEIKSNVSSGTLSVSPATGLSYDSSTGKIYMTPSQITSTNGADVSNSYTLTLTLDSNTKASVSIPTTTKVGSWSSTVSSSTTDNYAATCTTTGWRNLKRCSECGTITAWGSSIAALGHSWETTGSVTTAATCEDAGVRTYKCTRSGCSKTKTESIEALGHDFATTYTVDKAATCADDGSESQHCSRCSATQNSRTISATGNHTAGTKTTTSYTSGTSVDQTHKRNWTSTCTVCGKSFSGSDSWESCKLTSTTVPSTCTTEGSTEYTCSVCEGSYTEALELAEHTWKTTYTTDTAATCTTAGSKSYHCSVCDAIKPNSSVTISALGHSWNSGSVTTAATCEDAGVRTYKCTRSGCSETQTESIAALGHNMQFVKYTGYTEAYASGYHYHNYSTKCSRCSTTDTDYDFEQCTTGTKSYGSWTNYSSSQHSRSWTIPCTLCDRTLDSGTAYADHDTSDDTKYTAQNDTYHTKVVTTSCSVCSYSTSSTTKNLSHNFGSKYTDTSRYNDGYQAYGNWTDYHYWYWKHDCEDCSRTVSSYEKEACTFGSKTYTSYTSYSDTQHNAYFDHTCKYCERTVSSSEKESHDLDSTYTYENESTDYFADDDDSGSHKVTKTSKCSKCSYSGTSTYYEHCSKTGGTDSSWSYTSTNHWKNDWYKCTLCGGYDTQEHPWSKSAHTKCGGSISYNGRKYYCVTCAAIYSSYQSKCTACTVCGYQS